MNNDAYSAEAVSGIVTIAKEHLLQQIVAIYLPSVKDDALVRQL